MSIIRWNPLRDVTAWHPITDLGAECAGMQCEIDRMFDRFRGDMTDDGSTSSWLPAVDVLEHDDQYIVRVELPGIDKKDVKITVHKDVLTIRGEKRKTQETKKENYHRIERAFGSFQRSFALPSSVQSEKIEASYENGILSVSLPKVEEAKAKEIEVKLK